MPNAPNLPAYQRTHAHIMAVTHTKTESIDIRTPRPDKASRHPLGKGFARITVGQYKAEEMGWRGE